MGMDKVVDFIKEILPMSKEEEKGLEFIRAFITNPEFKRVEKLLKLDKIEISQFVLKNKFRQK
jgi:hypothetical protein